MATQIVEDSLQGARKKHLEYAGDCIRREHIPPERVRLQFEVVTTFSSFRSSDLSQSI